MDWNGLEWTQMDSKGLKWTWMEACNRLVSEIFKVVLLSLEVKTPHANLSLNYHILEAAMRSFQKQILHLV